MAAGLGIPIYGDALVVLGTAGIVVPMVYRWGFSPVLGYLAAGALLGPLGLGALSEGFPLLRWITITDARNVAGIADLGVVFLFFLIGLELSFERLMAMRRLVFGLGTAQVVLSATLIALALLAAQIPLYAAVLLGACLALSSTAIVLELLSAQGRLTSSVGRTSFAILLAQDLAVVPLLMFVAVLGSNVSGSLVQTIANALFQAAAAIALIVAVGRVVLRPLLRLVANAPTNDLFIAAILFVIVATGVIASLAQLSMALGAFVAGLLLAETEYRKAIEALIKPFKGLLLGIFFFTVGMGIDGRELARSPWLLAASVASLLTIKGIVIYCLARAFRQSRAVALEAALLLSPGGEFAFVILGLSASLTIVPAALSSFTLAVVSLTMALTPLLSFIANYLTPHLQTTKPLDPALLIAPSPQMRHAIVVGHGRVGKVVCSLLARHQVVTTAIDHDQRTVTEDRGRGDEVFYGDAVEPEFLKACGLMEASGVIITIHTTSLIAGIVTEIRKLRPDIIIVSRARDADHARQLYALGVTDAVPETIEASLQLSEAALVALGIPMGPVIASIHDQRDTFRRALQEAALSAGLSGAHSSRQKK